jgi:hypothetical protein
VSESHPEAILTVSLLTDGTVAVWSAHGLTTEHLAETLRGIAEGFERGATRLS